MKGMNAIQALGSEITYYRRYLYNIALDIVENDIIDSLDNTNKAKTNQNNAKMANKKQDPISELKQSIKALLAAKPEYEEEMKEISERTNRFTNMTNNQRADLMIRVQELIHEMPN